MSGVQRKTRKKMKINTNDYPRIFFTSDWHLGHNKEFLYGPRGCEGRDEHVKMLIDGINKLAGPNDLIIHLGDMSLTARYEELCQWLLDINCKNVWSLYGNHEGNFRKFCKQQYESFSFNNPPLTSDLEEEVMNTKNIRQLGQYCELSIIEPSETKGKRARKYSVTLCHFPMLLWNKSHHGSLHLCGHSHGSLFDSSPNNHEGKRLDCGIENAQLWSEGTQVMFSWEDIKKVMNGKRIPRIDHHNETTT